MVFHRNIQNFVNTCNFFGLNLINYMILLVLRSPFYTPPVYDYVQSIRITGRLSRRILGIWIFWKFTQNYQICIKNHWEEKDQNCYCNISDTLKISFFWKTVNIFNLFSMIYLKFLNLKLKYNIFIQRSL